MRIYNHIGEKIGTWTVVSIIPDRPKKTYLFKCECGKEKEVSSAKVYRKAECKFCIGKKSVEAHLGERNGKITCIGHVHKNRRHGFLVKCDCGISYPVFSYHQFLRTQCCESCRHGFYPGKKTGNCVLIKRADGRQWEKKCNCGNIFIADSRKTNCGCQIQERKINKAKAKIGLKLNYLKVIGIEAYKDKHIYLKVKCKCGKILSIMNGHEFKSKSCGCYLGTPVGEKSSKATLTDVEISSIRELFATGLYSEEELARMIHKSKYYVRRILKRQIWKHI